VVECTAEREAEEGSGGGGFWIAKIKENNLIFKMAHFAAVSGLF